jgi:hypothetical protein
MASLLAGIVAHYAEYWIDLFAGVDLSAKLITPDQLKDAWRRSRRGWLSEKYVGPLEPKDGFSGINKIIDTIARNRPRNFFELIRQASYQFSEIPAGILSMHYSGLNAPSFVVNIDPNGNLTLGMENEREGLETFCSPSSEILQEYFAHNPEIGFNYRRAARGLPEKEGRIIQLEVAQIMALGYVGSLRGLWRVANDDMNPLWTNWDSIDPIQKGLADETRDLFLLTVGPAIHGYMPITVNIPTAANKSVKLLVSPYPFMELYMPPIPLAEIAIVSNGVLLKRGEVRTTVDSFGYKGLIEIGQKIKTTIGEAILKEVKKLLFKGVEFKFKVSGRAKDLSYPDLRRDMIVSPDEPRENVAEVLRLTSDKGIAPSSRLKETEKPLYKVDQSGNLVSEQWGNPSAVMIGNVTEEVIRDILQLLNRTLPSNTIIRVLQAVLYRIHSITYIPQLVRRVILDEAQDVSQIVMRTLRSLGLLSIVGDEFQRLLQDLILAGWVSPATVRKRLLPGLRNTVHSSIFPISRVPTPIITTRLGNKERESLPFQIPQSRANILYYSEGIRSMFERMGMQVVGTIPNPYGVSVVVVEGSSIDSQTKTVLRQKAITASMTSPPQKELSNIQYRPMMGAQTEDVAAASGRRDHSAREQSRPIEETDAERVAADASQEAPSAIRITSYGSEIPRHTIFQDITQRILPSLRSAIEKSASPTINAMQNILATVFIEQEGEGEIERSKQDTTIEELVKSIAFAANFLADLNQVRDLLEKGTPPVVVVSIPDKLIPFVSEIFVSIQDVMRNNFEVEGEPQWR